jgi:predicted nucleotidyltransferase
LSQPNLKENFSSSRSKVAREAASLLYFGLEKEYRQAKLKAAENLNVRVLPSNLEVALALDQIAEETEGPHRKAQLVQMRVASLQIMRILEQFHPVLIGSVWRGTIRRGSDIDIEIYYDEPQDIVSTLRDYKLQITKPEWASVTEHGKTCRSFHIHAEFSGGYEIEIVIRGREDFGQKRICDTFGDEIRGLNIRELEKLLAKDATGRFLPS